MAAEIKLVPIQDAANATRNMAYRDDGNGLKQIVDLSAETLNALDVGGSAGSDATGTGPAPLPFINVRAIDFYNGGESTAIITDGVVSRHIPPGIGRLCPVSPRGGTVILDEFTDAANTRLQSHTPNVDSVGGGWIEVNGVWRLDGTGQVTTEGSGSSRRAYIDSGASSHEVECQLWGAGHAVAVRMHSSTDNMLFVGISGSTNALVLGQRINGDASVLSQTAPDSYPAGAALKIITTPTSVAAVVDGVTVLSAATTLHASLTGVGFVRIGTGSGTYEGFTVTAAGEYEVLASTGPWIATPIT